MQVSDHFNAEVVAGTIGSKQDAVDYMTWTFLYRRLLQNPAYYDLEGTAAEDVNEYLSALVERTFTTLQVGTLAVVHIAAKADTCIFCQNALGYNQHAYCTLMLQQSLRTVPYKAAHA